MNESGVSDLVIQEGASKTAVQSARPSFPVQSPAALVLRARQWSNMMDSLRAAAIVLTANPRFWANYNGTPRPTAKASSRIAQAFGVRAIIEDRETVKETDELGPLVTYEFYGVARLEAMGLEIPIMGSCNSRDPFFGTVQGEPKPLHQIHLPNVKKKALNNFRVNAVIEACGLRGLTWEDLKKHGVEQSEQEEVSFRHGDQGGKAHEERGEESDAQLLISRLAWWGAAVEKEGVDLCFEYFTNKQKETVPWEQLKRWRTKGQLKWISDVLAKLAKRYPELAADLKKIEEAGELADVPK